MLPLFVCVYACVERGTLLVYIGTSVVKGFCGLDGAFMFGFQKKNICINICQRNIVSTGFIETDRLFTW